MLSNVLSRVKGLLDKRFALSYLAPASVGATCVAFLAAVEHGVRHVVARWQELNATSAVSGGVGIVAVLILVAYLLQSAMAPVLQFWEGWYLPGWLARIGVTRQARRAARLAAEVEQMDNRVPHGQRYFAFPHDPRRLRPTRLGNVFAAAEEYPFAVYGVDGVLWWPRLLAVLPDRLHEQIDDATVPLVSLLNLGTVIAAIATGAGVVLLFAGRTWVPFWAPPLIGIPLAWLCYRAAVGRAVSFGTLVRVAFDFHRMDILRHMSIPQPENYETERALWERLNRWTRTFAPPGEGGCASDPAWMRAPFTYAPPEEEEEE